MKIELQSRIIQLYFFQYFWELVKQDVLSFVHEFFERGIISKDLRASFITLVPKKAGAIKLNEGCWQRCW